MDNIQELFDLTGKCLNPIDSYFDEDGGFKYYSLIFKEYNKYPSNSDVVKMFYAEEYASETHGNYSASTLYYRANI